jgi:amidase
MIKDQWNAFFNQNVAIDPTGKGSLDGLVFSVKDVFAIQHYQSSAGNPTWLRTHEESKRNAVTIDMLLNQGAKLRGTTHTDELMYSLNGENFHYGTPINPKAPGRIPGGSSSGAAVSVAAKTVDFALGTDTGGSVRIPSSYCGIYGFRPTHGAVPIEGVIPLAKSYDTVGWMANNIDLLLKIGHVLLPQLKEDGDFTNIEFAEEAWELLEGETKAAFLPFLKLLEEEGEKSRWQRISQEGLAEWSSVFRTIQGIEIWKEHEQWIEKENPIFGPGISERFSWTSTLKKEQNEAAYKLREKITNELTHLLGEDGILVIPTAPGGAPLLNLQGEAAEKYRAKTMSLSCIAGLARLPQVTLPVVEVNGIPVGLSLIANRSQDLKLLRWSQRFLRKIDQSFVASKRGENV